MPAVSRRPPSLPSPWASGRAKGLCLEKAAARALGVHCSMSCGERPLILGGPIRPRMFILTWGEGRLKGPRGAFLWHWSPRMEDAGLGELQPQPLSLEFRVLAHGTSGTHFEAPVERYPSHPSPRTRQPGYGHT